MPFRSKAQRRWMYANEPAMAKRWESETPKGKSLPEKVKASAIDVLTGMSGSGKSTLAKKLEHHYDYVTTTDLGHFDDKGMWVRGTPEERAAKRQAILDKVLSLHEEGKNVLVEGVPAGVHKLLGDEHLPKANVYHLPVSLEESLERVRKRALDRGSNAEADVESARSFNSDKWDEHMGLIKRYIKKDVHSGVDKLSYYAAFYDELEKIAIDAKSLGLAASRVKNVVPATGTPLDSIGAFTVPTVAHGSLRNAPAVKEMSDFQNKIIPSHIMDALKPHMESYYPKNPGQIVVPHNIGNVLHPGASPQAQGNLRDMTILHEGMERRAIPKPGSLHLSPDVLVQERNMLGSMKEPALQEARSSMEELRIPEHEILKDQFNSAFKDPRASTFLEGSEKVRPAMRRAFSQKAALLTPGQATGAMQHQGNTLGNRINRLHKKWGAGVVPGSTTSFEHPSGVTVHESALNSEELHPDIMREFLKRKGAG